MFDIKESQHLAEARLSRPAGRGRRSDAGRSRLPAPALAELRAATLGMERPSVAALRRRLADACARSGRRPPSRASLYSAFDRIDGHLYQVSELPPAVVECLYNLAPDATLPGHQLVFYCLNYGSPAAMSFAAGLPWLDLHQARRLRGWRERSRGLLLAVLRVREG